MKHLLTQNFTASTLLAVPGGSSSLLLWLLLINLLAFVLMGVDKKRAAAHQGRRIPEKRLFLAALLGGSAGALLGMYAFRHKTKHPRFVLGMPALLVLQAALALLLLR